MRATVLNFTATSAAVRSTVSMVLLAIATSFVGSLAGCGAADSRIAAERKRLVLAEEPQGATSIADAAQEFDRAARRDAGRADRRRRSRAVREGAGLFRPVGSAGRRPPARRLGHDAGNCPFCRHRAKETPLALVQMVDEQGEILKTDVPTLLGLAAGQMVVVRGRGQWNDKLELLVVKAGGIHIRK